jgi:serine/threonine-protein kinase
LRLVDKLEKFKRERTNGLPFETLIDFEKWADSVSPLLSFDSKYSHEFDRSVTAATVTYRMKNPVDSATNMNNAIGILNKAITVASMRDVSEANTEEAILISKPYLIGKLKVKEIETVFGKLEGLKLIGEGGNGLVYSAKLAGSEVAVKFLVETGNTKLERFKAEFLNVRLAGSSPYIAEAIHYEEVLVDGHKIPAIFMRLYRGALKRVEPTCQKKDQLHDLFSFLIKSISFIHDRNIIHRDIKPQNILISDDGYKLADFGIAKFCPESFKLKAETKKGERLANYLYSAPEQSQASVDINKSVDIYAAGQVIQWFAFGEIHRGTERKKLITLDKDLWLLDEIVDRCIRNSPDQRFQNCNEIESYIKKRKKDSAKEDPWDGLKSFAKVIRMCFPKKYSGYFDTKDKRIIQRFFVGISQDDFRGKLIWFDGYRDSEFSGPVNEISEGVWLIDSYECKISRLYGYFDTSLYADVVFIEISPSEHFGVHDLGPDSTLDCAGLIDDKTLISKNELHNGFAEIDGALVDLSTRKEEERSRYLVPTTIALATKFHSACRIENDSYISDFIEGVNYECDSLEDTVKNLVDKTRRNKDPHIAMTL